MSERRFMQLDVFASGPFSGNPLAVVIDGGGLSTEEMQRFTDWTNLSEATFLLPPTDPTADYRVRIFCPGRELPFAGHPTLGSCAAWLAAGGTPYRADEIVQECGAGLIPIRREGERLAFAAPPMTRRGPIEPELLAERLDQLGLGPERCRRGGVDRQRSRLDGDPARIGGGRARRAAPLVAVPGFDVGLVGLHPEDAECAVEVRAFFADASGVDPRGPGDRQPQCLASPSG